MPGFKYYSKNWGGKKIKAEGENSRKKLKVYEKFYWAEKTPKSSKCPLKLKQKLKKYPNQES